MVLLGVILLVVGVLERGVALLLVVVELLVAVELLLELVLVVLVVVLEGAEAVVVAARVNKNDLACDHRTMGSSAQWLMRVSSDRRDRAMSGGEISEWCMVERDID